MLQSSANKMRIQTTDFKKDMQFNHNNKIIQEYFKQKKKYGEKAIYDIKMSY